MQSENEHNARELSEKVREILEETDWETAKQDREALDRQAEEIAKYNAQQTQSGKVSVPRSAMLIFQWWERIASGDEKFPEEFKRFIAIWLAFNGFLNLQFPEIKHKDREKVLMISKNTRLKAKFDELLSDSTFKGFLDGAHNLCPIYDVEGGTRGTSFSIDPPYELDKVLNLIYHVRCNLLHGEKGELTERNKRIGDLAYCILLRLYTVVKVELYYEPRTLSGE